MVANGPDGRTDPVRRVLTFTSAPLEDDLEVVGPIKLVLHAASSNTDTDFIVKLSEQFPQASTEQGKVQPRFRVVSKGWMKASHRELNKQLSTEYAPWYAHTKVEPLEPGKAYAFEVPVMPTANLFKKGSRIRLELANGDSSITDFVFEHLYLPNKIGKDPDIEADTVSFLEESAATRKGALAWITKRQGYLFFPLLLLGPPAITPLIVFAALAVRSVITSLAREVIDQGVADARSG